MFIHSLNTKTFEQQKGKKKKQQTNAIGQVFGVRLCISSINYSL